MVPDRARELRAGFERAVKEIAQRFAVARNGECRRFTYRRRAADADLAPVHIARYPPLPVPVVDAHDIVYYMHHMVVRRANGDPRNGLIQRGAAPDLHDPIALKRLDLQRSDLRYMQVFAYSLDRARVLPLDTGILFCHFGYGRVESVDAR